MFFRLLLGIANLLRNLLERVFEVGVGRLQFCSVLFLSLQKCVRIILNLFSDLKGIMGFHLSTQKVVE